MAVEIEPILHDTCSRFEELWAELPEEWLEVAELLPNFSKERCLSVLGRFSTAATLFGGTAQ